MASSSQIKKYTIDKLNTKKYRLWKPRMELMLDLEDLLEVTTKVCQAPRNAQQKCGRNGKLKTSEQSLKYVYTLKIDRLMLFANSLLL